MEIINTVNGISRGKRLFMNSVGLQIYTVRDFTGTPEGLKDAFLQIKAAGYDYVQTAGLITDVESAKYFKACADAAGVGICGTHYNWKLIVENLAKNLLDEAAWEKKLHDYMDNYI